MSFSKFQFDQDGEPAWKQKLAIKANADCFLNSVIYYRILCFTRGGSWAEKKPWDDQRGRGGGASKNREEKKKEIVLPNPIIKLEKSHLLNLFKFKILNARF